MIIINKSIIARHKTRLISKEKVHFVIFKVGVGKMQNITFPIPLYTAYTLRVNSVMILVV